MPVLGVMDPRRALLDALRGGPAPPRILADRLGVPIADVRDHVEALRDAGYAVNRGEAGYRLDGVPEYGEGLMDGFDSPFDVEYRPSVPSTNDHARDLAREGRVDVAVVADRQTGGRGRRGNRWASPRGGIYLSLIVRPDLPPDRVPLLTLAAGVAVVRAVAPLGVDASLKWPNDVLVGDDGRARKLAGILTESSVGGGSVDWAIVGVGVNANAGPGRLPGDAVSLRELVDGRVDRGPLTREIIDAFHSLERSPDAIPVAWRAAAATTGRHVRVETASGTVTGPAVDIDPDGALLVETGDGVRRVTAGECEHLRPT